MCWLIRNDQDLGNIFLEFSMRVRNFEWLVRAILVINKQCLYYYKCWLIRYDQDLGNVFHEFSMRVRNFAGLIRVILVINKQPQY